MSDPLLKPWRVSDQAIANAVADETVILHLGNGTYYGLDAIGARLWEALRDGAAPESVCAELLDTYDVEPARLADDLRTLLGELEANELIEPA